MTHRPDFRRALVGLPISLVVLGVLSLVVPEKKPEQAKLQAKRTHKTSK